MPSTTRAGPRAPRLAYQPGIDGLRAISVAAVIAYHAGTSGTSGTPGGFLGVEVFFVVSGYLITSLLLAERRESGHVSLRHFWARRARRLLPALFALLAVVTAYSILFLPDAAYRLRTDVPAALAYVSNWWQIFHHESYFVAAGRPPLLRHLWSLAVEEQFYLIWPPVLALALTRFSRRRILVGVLVGAAASAALMALLFHPYTDPSRVYYGTDTRAAGLLLGAALAFVWTPQRFRGRPGRGAGLLLDAVGAVGLVGLWWSFTRVNEFDPFVYRGGFVVIDLATLLVIAACVHPAARVGKVLGIRPLREIGLRSYGIYLWHWPVFAVTRPGLDVGLHGWPLLLLRLVATGALAELSYRYVERPVRSGAAVERLREAFHRTRGRMRARLVTRLAMVGAVGVTAIALLVVGLARVPTPSAAASLEARLAAEGDQATTTTAAPTTTTTKPATTATTDPHVGGAATTTPTTAPTTSATTTPPTSAPRSVTAIGDSVMLGAKPELEAAIPGIRVDAQVSRQFGQAISILAAYRDSGQLGSEVVVDLGTNGAFGSGQLDDLMRTVGKRKVLFVNTYVPRPWQDLVNQRLAQGAARWPNATLVDWHAAAGPHHDFFAPDGFHLEPVGARFYANLIKSHL